MLKESIELPGRTVAVVVVDVRLQDAMNHLEQIVRMRTGFARGR